jgi:hypothetical protein
MSEQLRSKAEKTAEQLDTSAETIKNLERLEKESSRHDEYQDTAEIQRHVENQAMSGSEISIESSSSSDTSPIGLQQELKEQSYQKTMSRVRSRLSKPEQAFSKAIHSPLIESASNSLGKTIVRPSGVLGGGLAALAGSAFLLYSASYFGYSYNYTAFFLLYAAGFLLGIAVEAVVKLFRR